MIEEPLKITNFCHTVIMEPTMFLTLQEGKLYQLWYCKYTNTKEWKEINSEIPCDIQFQKGIFK